MNCGVDTFNNILSEMYDKYYPMIEKQVKNKPRIPWINKVILNAMKIRDKFKSIGRFNKYKWWSNRVVNLIRSNKKNHFQHIIQKAKGNSQKIWTHINSLSKSAQKNVNVPVALSCDNALITDKLEMANLLNHNFVTVSFLHCST